MSGSVVGLCSQMGYAYRTSLRSGSLLKAKRSSSVRGQLLTRVRRHDDNSEQCCVIFSRSLRQVLMQVRGAKKCRFRSQAVGSARPHHNHPRQPYAPLSNFTLAPSGDGPASLRETNLTPTLPLPIIRYHYLGPICRSPCNPRAPEYPRRSIGAGVPYFVIPASSATCAGFFLPGDITSLIRCQAGPLPVLSKPTHPFGNSSPQNNLVLRSIEGGVNHQPAWPPCRLAVALVVQGDDRGSKILTEVALLCELFNRCVTPFLFFREPRSSSSGYLMSRIIKE